ncbi:MAG: aminopeptidase P family protein [Phycisphaerales bacterium]|nr:aminopeptidase P family protein [Phycisphaerales bacterium]
MSSDRLLRITAAMADADLDALFVSNPKNVLYLTNFHSTMPGEVQPFNDPEGLVVIVNGEAHLLCDGRYIAGARQLENVTAHQITSPSNSEVFAKTIRGIVGEGKRTIGFEADALLYADGAALLASLPEYTWKASQSIFAKMRVIKSADEIALIREAQAITGRCFEHIAGWIRPGLSERDVAVEIETFMRQNSEGNSFAPIVAFGQTGCHPHYAPSPDRRLEVGQMVLLDFGAIYKGYCGDMTRMLVMGKADDRHKEVYDLVLQAQLRCLEGVKPGATCHSLDALCRDYFESRGCADRFQHGTGHGVGLAIHEDPRIKKGFEERVEPGMVFSVEPGLYYEDWGGVRIEDLVAVTADGYDNLTTTSKALLEVAP